LHGLGRWFKEGQNLGRWFKEGQNPGKCPSTAEKIKGKNGRALKTRILQRKVHQGNRIQSLATAIVPRTVV